LHTGSARRIVSLVSTALAQTGRDDVAFIISNTNGKQGREWSADYETRAEAVEAIKVAMGWESVAVSPSFADVLGTSWCCYASAAERDEDQEGAHAPRVIELEAEGE